MHTPLTLELKALELDPESFRLIVLNVVFPDLTNDELALLLGI